tara:strand:- start:621 stop:1112 length:492 start_codon:yes stop_codon:yes gene_type:complete
MDQGSTIIGLIILALCIIPFIIIRRNKIKRERLMLKSLTDLANLHNCKINEHELCGDYAIGIDKLKNYLFFYKKMKDKETTQFINLESINSCKILNSSRTIKNKQEKYHVIDRLSLSLKPNLEHKKEQILEFFNSDYNSQTYGELQSIEKWLKLVNLQLKLKS